MATMISKVQAELSDEAIKKIENVVAAWRGEGGDYQDVAGFCRSAKLSEIAEHGYVLTAGRYVGTEEVEEDTEAFDDKMQNLIEQLGHQITKGEELDALIKQRLKGLGYDY